MSEKNTIKLNFHEREALYGSRIKGSDGKFYHIYCVLDHNQNETPDAKLPHEINDMSEERAAAAVVNAALKRKRPASTSSSNDRAAKTAKVLAQSCDSMIEKPEKQRTFGESREDGEKEIYKSSTSAVSPAGNRQQATETQSAQSLRKPLKLQFGSHRSSM